MLNNHKLCNCDFTASVMNNNRKLFCKNFIFIIIWVKCTLYYSIILKNIVSTIELYFIEKDSKNILKNSANINFDGFLKNKNLSSTFICDEKIKNKFRQKFKNRLPVKSRIKCYPRTVPAPFYASTNRYIHVQKVSRANNSTIYLPAVKCTSQFQQFPDWGKFFVIFERNTRFYKGNKINYHINRYNGKFLYESSEFINKKNTDGDSDSVITDNSEINTFVNKNRVATHSDKRILCSIPEDCELQNFDISSIKIDSEIINDEILCTVKNKRVHTHVGELTKFKINNIFYSKCMEIDIINSQNYLQSNVKEKPVKGVAAMWQTGVNLTYENN
jgi:hypothetical protein